MQQQRSLPILGAPRTARSGGELRLIGASTTVRVVATNQLGPVSSTDPAPQEEAPKPPVQSEIFSLSRSLPPIKYQPLQADDPRYVPHLPDLTGNAIDLTGRVPGDAPSDRRMVMVEHAPALPFWPGSYSRSNYLASMSDAELFVRAWRPKQIPPWAFTSVQGWKRLPSPAPVYTLIPHFGASVAFYWRYMRVPAPASLHAYPILVYAVQKLQPLPGGSSNDVEYGGAYWEVFAAWCKPLKWIVSQYPTNNSADPYDVLILTDEGTEFLLPLNVLRTEDDPRLVVCRNVLMRDYPFLRQQLAIRPVAPPPDMLAAIARNALAQQGQQQALSGDVRLKQVIPGAPSNYPGAVALVPAPPQQQQQQQQQAEDEEEEEEEEEGSEDENQSAPPAAAAPEEPVAVPATAPSAAPRSCYQVIRLSDNNAMHVRPVAAARV